MWKFGLDDIIVTFVFIINVNSLKISNPQNPIHRLSDLVSHNSNKPLVVVVNTKSQRNTDFDELFANGDDGLVDDDGSHQKSDANDDAAYILYHLLRTTKQDDTPDPVLEETKHTLRQAIRVKCKRVEECIIECPPAKPQCPVNCQQTFDNLKLCPPSRPKKQDYRPKCGKTMPPKWFF